jgi:hypothetical protein
MTPSVHKEVGTNLADERRSVDLYRSLSHSGHGVSLYVRMYVCRAISQSVNQYQRINVPLYILVHHLSLSLPTHPPSYSTFLPTHPPSYSTYLPTHPPSYSTYLPTHLATPPTYPPTHLPTHLATPPLLTHPPSYSIYLPTHPPS